MTFGSAVSAMEGGKQVCRAGWNGKGMFVFLHKPKTNKDFPAAGEEPSTLPYIVMKTVTGDRIPWLASQADVLALDWEISTAKDWKEGN